MTMWGTHLRRLAEYCDGRMTADEHARARAHLTGCARCRASVDEFQFAAGLVRQLAVVHAPDSLWSSIETALDSSAGPTVVRDVPARVSFWHTGRLAVAALITIAALAASYWYVTRAPEAAWRVVRLEGSAAPSRLAVGAALETNASSRLRLTVGTIGTVDVAPNTRIRLLSAQAAEQRLTLDHGEITATISAPPRLFFVNTASSTVVDLGCQYTMRMSEDGIGNLHVTLGWTSLEWSGRESLVPAGASCQTRPGVGPGMPSFDDASAELKEAVASFDFANGGVRALDAMLAAARARDTLTLWHLLSRVDPGDRSRVVDRMVALTPLPSGVTRDKAIALDPDTLKRWREELAWTW